MYFRPLFTILASVSCLAAWAQQEVTATYPVNGNVEREQYRSHVTLESVADNGSVVYAYGSVYLNLTGVKMNKTAGTGTYTDREDRGTNSALLATDGSHVTAYKCEVRLHADRSYGIAATGEGTEVKVNEGKTTMSKQQSSAFHSTGGALIDIDKFEISSFSKMSPLLSTGQGGRIEAVNLTGGTSGIAAPLFSCRGDIHVSESRLESKSAPVGHVKGSGTISLDKCEFIQVSSCDFYISKGNGTAGRIVMNGCKVNLKDGPLLLVDDGCVTVELKKNTLSSTEDGLISIKGGKVSLTAENQKLKGDIVADSVCSVTLNLGKGAMLGGAVNGTGNRDADVTVSIGKGAIWYPWADSHVSAISFQQGVENGAKQIKGKSDVYYDASNPANSYLEGREYRLGGQGMLIPE